MFQSFDLPSRKSGGAERLARLRGQLREMGLDGFLIPHADAHQGEAAPERDQRLGWLTGFTGSAGLCAALMERAAIFVDGRYTLQVGNQVDVAAFEPVVVMEVKPEDWIAENLPEGARLGYDSWLHTVAEVARLRAAVERAGGALVAAARNPVDAIWADQPGPPTAAMRVHPDALAGQSAAAKRDEIAAILRADGLDAAVLTLPDSINWLLNIRGGDIARTPVALAFAVLRADGRVDLFADPDKADDAVRAHLGDAVAIAPLADFGPILDALAGRRVALDENSAPEWVGARLRDSAAEITAKRDPCIAPKARKNRAEIAGARAAHLRDGAAMANFLHWLDGAAPTGRLSEIDVVEKLETFRLATGALRDISFETICGAGPNGAIVHYRVSRETNRRVRPGELLLVDSGGQYADGTTDITRTIAVNGPADDSGGDSGGAERRCFTLTLKGMIAISTARWPKGLAGRDLDALARAALWRAGLDYDHGTGHGVGAYLSVHEGPQSLSRRGEAALETGMILSNEPGFYRAGAFGIRIENLMVVREPVVPDNGERAMHEFETLTLAPIDRRLIDAALLDAAERDWLNAYHARTLAEIGPLVEAPVRAWLTTACAPI